MAESRYIQVPYFVPDVPISPKLETLAVTKLIQVCLAKIMTMLLVIECISL